MRKLFTLIFVLFLAACSDKPGDAKWVAQTLPNVEEKKPIVLNGEVAIHSPTTTTSGYIIHQSKRDKWIVVSAQHIASHPYSLVYDENITLGETEAIDVANNIAIIHIRNGKDYSIEEIPSNGEINATKEQIDHLLNEALEQKMNWQQRLKKNTELLQHTEQEQIDNFTNYYEKNIFTYNSDELKRAGLHFISQLNESIEKKDQTLLKGYTASDDVVQALRYIKEPIKGYQIKDARKEGVYYFVDGVDEQKEEVRLTFVNDQEQFKVIGANFLTDEYRQEEKIPKVQLSNEQRIEAVPALQLFLIEQLPAIQLTVGQIQWNLEHEDKGIAVENGSAQFTCSFIDVKEHHLVLTGCINTKSENYIIATFGK